MTRQNVRNYTPGKGSRHKTWILKADLFGQFKTNRPHIIQSCCIIKANQIGLCGETIAVCCEIRVKYEPVGKMQNFLVLDLVAYILNTGLFKSNNSLYLLLLHKNNITDRHVKVVLNYLTSYVSVEVVLSFETSGWDYFVTQLHFSECETLVAVYFTRL
jgi:hypothetical protein